MPRRKWWDNSVFQFFATSFILGALNYFFEAGESKVALGLITVIGFFHSSYIQSLTDDRTVLFQRLNNMKFEMEELQRNYEKLLNRH